MYMYVPSSTIAQPQRTDQNRVTKCDSLIHQCQVSKNILSMHEAFSVQYFFPENVCCLFQSQKMQIMENLYDITRK